MKKIGVFSFTCCEGCIVVFIELLNKKFFEYKKKIKIENFRVLKTNEKINKLDIAFVEGAISTPSELRKLREIRKKSKILIALGSGASNGYPSNQRNNFSPEKKNRIKNLVEKFNQLEKISPLKSFVKVDDEINGCPIDEKSLENKIKKYIENA